MAKIFVRDLSTSVSSESIELAVTEFLEDHPIVGSEPLLEAHIISTTPHPVYDNLPAGKFVAYFRNGMA